MRIPKTQHAIIQPDRTSTRVALITDHPVPVPNLASNEHLIRVRMTAITNGELYWARNLPEEVIASKDPVTCNDVAGTVVTAPPHSDFPPGTEVFARSSFLRAGCARKYSILLHDEMAIRPQNVSWEQSVCTPMSALTAWQALFVHGGFEAKAGEGALGKKLFVTAASGAVGVWMVQLGRWAGAQVVATCSNKNVQRVQGLGATEVLDYATTDVKSWAEGLHYKADLVIDCAGGRALENAWYVVKDGGILISVVQPPSTVRPKSLEGSRVKDSFFIMESNGDQLKKIARMIDAGQMTSAVDSVIPFERYEEAFEIVESGSASGKVVLDLGEDDRE